MRNPGEQVFLQAVILQPDGKVVEYEPLVINQNTVPAVAPVPYTPPAGSTVGIFGGGNDVSTRLFGSGASACVNGAAGQVFGQVFFCGTPALFQAAVAAHVPVPPLGSDLRGDACPTVRDFRIVDQDQSDNVPVRYLVLPNGQTAQDTAHNRSVLNGYTVALNGSDNTLLSDFVDPAIGCRGWMLPSMVDPGVAVPTQFSNELQAATYQGHPVALIPAGDPMVGPNNLALLNAYRSSVDQPTVDALNKANTGSYCGKMQDIAPPFFQKFASQFTNAASPDPNMNLLQFLRGRFAASVQLLNCASFT